MSDKKCNCHEPYDAEYFEGGYPYCPIHDRQPDVAIIGHGSPTPDNALYETRLALRMVLKVFKNTSKSKEQEKYYTQGEYMLQKHFKITDVLRSESLSKEGNTWVTADTKPEHNVGVLVFIPGEENHITSGMWDISNEWVLLDEYRTPEEEVTHWMPMPSFPEGYEHDILSDEWVSTLKAIAKEELSKRPKEGNKEREMFTKEKFDAYHKWLSEKHYTFDGEYYYDEGNNFFKPEQIWNEWNNQQNRNNAND